MNRSVTIVMVFLGFILCFQNCANNGFSPVSALTTSSNQSSNGTPNNTTPPPALSSPSLTANKVQDCFTNSNYNTCIFWKNPIAMNGAALAQPISANSDLSAEQIQAVNISPTDYDKSGFLSNSSISVSATNGTNILQRVSTNMGQFKYHYGNDPNHMFSQVMAFYWINFQINYMSQRSTFYAKDKAINVYSWYPGIENAFWSPTQKEVVIGEVTTASTGSGVGNEFSVGAEIYLHEMGHADIANATNFTIYNGSNSNLTQTCSKQFPNDTCCMDTRGCFGGMDEGQADYHAAIIFPSNTALGEALVNDPNGFSECGITRKVDANTNLTVTQAYNACGTGILGEVHLMGRVYASIWWVIRKKYAAIGDDQAQMVDKLFSEHIKLLASTDAFLDALTKIKSADAALFNSKFSVDFQNEFARRGIQ